MDRSDKRAPRSEDELRRQAAAWFARLRGPDAQAQQADFDRWRSARSGRQEAYDRLVRRWDDAAVLDLSDAYFGRTDSFVNGRLRPAMGRWGLGALAAAGGLAALIYLAPVRPDMLDAWPVPSAWSQRLATPVGEIRMVKLPDGSSVTLDTGTVVRWRFSASARRLALLQGRARFAVAHDPNRPFVVSAGGGEVAAHGTLFDVSLSSSRGVTVTLLQGVVEVDAASGTGRHKRTRLAPGQALAFGDALPVPQVRPLAPSAASWPSGMLTFASTPLSQAVAEANRYSRTPIRLASPDLALLRVSGAYRASASRPLAEDLAAAFDLRVREEPDGALVLERPPTASAP